MCISKVIKMAFGSLGDISVGGLSDVPRSVE